MIVLNIFTRSNYHIHLPLTLPILPSAPTIYPSQLHDLFLLLLKTSWVQLVLPICSWICGHTLGHEQPTSSCIPKENESPFFSTYQLPIIPPIMRSHVFLSHSYCIDGLILCRSCTDNHSFCELMSATATSCLEEDFRGPPFYPTMIPIKSFCIRHHTATCLGPLLSVSWEPIACSPRYVFKYWDILHSPISPHFSLIPLNKVYFCFTYSHVSAFLTIRSTRQGLKWTRWFIQ